MNIGSHLVSPRQDYEHHGIYVGNDKVIHFGGFDKSAEEGEIVLTSMDTFCKGMSCRIETHWLRVFDEHESVLRAHSRLGERGYCAMTNNCEHFVSWCISGVHSSAQVNAVVMGGLVLVGVLARLLW
jgi:hypothetical protein